jgi:diguanylate cyclase (GGDEF)-like protein
MKVRLFQHVGTTALAVALCICSAVVQASGIKPLGTRTALFDRLTLEEGLSQTVVHTIVQDQQGFIWLGTQEGLNRYDGREIKVYENIHDDPDSLSDSYVWSVYVAADGTLWAGTNAGGLNRYDRATDSFHHYRHDPSNPNSLSSDRVRVVYQDASGHFWIGTDGGGLNMLNVSSGAIQHYRHDPENPASLANDSILSILEDRAGNLWVGTDGGGFSLLDRKTSTFRHFQHNPEDADSISGNSVRRIFQDREGRLWVGTYENGLNLFEANTGHFQRFSHDPADPRSLSHNRVRDIFQDYKGSIWIGTDHGLNEWRPSEGGFAHYFRSLTDTSSISDNRITAIMQDRGGVLWVGTYNGANSWNYLSDSFTYFQADGTALRLSSDIVTSVDESSNGELWVGTYGGGLNRINETGKTVSYYREGETSGLADNRVMTVHVGPTDGVWIGTRSGGLSRFDPRSETYTHYRHSSADPQSISSDGVTSILAEVSGIVWAGTYGDGLNMLDSRTGKVHRFYHDPENPGSLSSNRVLSIFRDGQGVLWVGTEDGGLNSFDHERQRFVRYTHEAGNSHSLSHNTAWVITETNDGSLWVGTNGGGLNRWRAEDRNAGIVRFTKQFRHDGLPSDSIQAIVEGNDGKLWLSTNRGLAQYDPANDRYRYFTHSNGLRSNEFNFDAALRTRGSRLLFGGSEGLLAFYPNQITGNRHEPDIVLKAFDRGGPLLTRHSTDTGGKDLTFDYQNDLVTFTFSGLDYADPARNLYRYKLEGFDDEWSAPTSYNRATYTNLPAGDFVFRVQASNNEGFWNETGVSTEISVLPPPWMTGWAYALYLLLAISLFYLFNRAQSLRLARETRQRRQLEKLVSERTRELADRNNELESLNVELKESSLRDSLTGLKNRRFLSEYIDSEVAQARRRADELSSDENQPEALDIAPALSFMMIDLDGFKAINDHFGHIAGDAALLQVRDILLDCCRKSDTVIRWGGDEFLIVSRNTSSRAAEKLAERIRVGLAEHQFQVGSDNVGQLTGSIGFAVYPFSLLNPDLVHWEEVTKIADRGAYIAKQNGRDAWVGIYGNRETTAEDVAEIETDLEGLLARRRIGIRTSISEKLALRETHKRGMQGDRT